MTLVEYFSRQDFLCETPEHGQQSDWLDFSELGLKGGQVLVADVQFVPSEEDGLLVRLSPGNYLIQARAINYGGDRRVSHVRVFKAPGIPKLGEKLGETWTDTARTGICDFERFSRAWGSDHDVSCKIIEPYLESEHYGIAVLDATQGIVMPFVDSGFGDGAFPVFELLADGERVGFEIEFIAEGTPYPFGKTPFQRETRIGGLEARAERGDADAQWELGKMYRQGEDVRKDLEKAASWFEKAAQNGKAEAANALGAMYQKGNGVAQDHAKAKVYFERAAARGLASALNNLGVIYSHGYGVSKNVNKALEYYREAAGKGSADAQYNLALHYTQGLGVEKNEVEAVKWYRLAVDQGHRSAMCNLGHFYRNGIGVVKNEQEAVRLFEMGAEKDHAICAHNLGDCYATGSGVKKNLTKALYWYHKAARKGVAPAQKSLALLLKEGPPGVTKNLTSALRWLREAAKNGDAEAQYELGLLYEQGEGVAADKVEACRFYQRAVTGGFAKAEERLKQLVATLTDEERNALTGA